MSSHITLCFVILFCAVIHNTNAQGFLDKYTHNPCISKSSCRECIRTKSCAWCMKEDFGDSPRCFEPSVPSYRQCPEEFIVNPDNEEKILFGRNLTRAKKMITAQSDEGYFSGAGYQESYSYSSSSGSSSYGQNSYSYSQTRRIVQISPQRVSLKMRVNEAHKLHFQYAQAEDYPVDLYYLMDLSKSMEDDKEKLSILGDLLSQTMRNITSNFRLGFGSFVDKVLMPYVSTIPKNLQEPCTGCAAPYGYRHIMALNTDTDSFSEEVRKAAVSGNLDAPEGGFDAIMQAVVCRQQIGWRHEARRLLVFSTDAGFHYAGDGKLGGVIEPNDGLCHLERNAYTHSTILDYPSISQINEKVKENAINIIFAVTSTQRDVYEKLSQQIEGSSCATLSNDSSNVVELVKEEYSKITSAIEMKDNATGSIKIKYYSACLDNSKPTETNKCDKLKVGDIVSFTAEIVVTSCPENPAEWHQTFQIYPVGINESLIVDLEMLCSCDCERQGHKMFELKSPKCNSQGTYKCGVCECYDKYYGRRCECSSEDTFTKDFAKGCRSDNTTKIDCSGRGICQCGVCECNKRERPDEVISGRFCECDNFSCDRHNQLLCSGEEHGTCECGVCICKPGWMGPACECRNSTDTCMAPGGKEICSGHGECECGSCKCEVTTEGRYSGRFCEKCPTCAKRCDEFKNCVQCQVYKTGPLKGEDCASNCTLFTPIEVEKIVHDEENDEQLCQFYDEDDCKFVFKYREVGSEKIEVHAEKERKCPPKVFVLGIVLAVIAAIVLFGLAILLLWKLFTTIHDRREFARFEKERMMAKWDTGENPIYKQATSTFKNPTYAGK
ncbi:integrin beta-PS isoform X2 [Condylostylus longicornis]|uniref:integrin beta-PS isoform X2 n=1 Tax=Condylostylus longicornis TaxID=2530218 RepID=UPI00244E17F6|nr:integrin beta-PS isoform X2 [Condylostylus longicornis]